MQVNLLGPIELIGDDGPVALGGPTRRAVLAALALNHGRVVSVDALLAGVWPGDGPSSGAGALQSAISRLRGALAEAGGGSITAAGAGYVLRLPPDALDLERLDGLSPADALALWRGPALEEFADRIGFTAERRRLDELRWSLVEQRVQTDLAAGRDAELIGELESLVAAEPLRESLWEYLLTALERSGRQADALRAFQRCREALAEAGLEPSQRLVALEHAVVTGESSPTAPMAPTGDITFLFTDVVGSTKRWEADPVAMTAALAIHDATIDTAVSGRGGRVLKSKGEGDSTVSVFTSAAEALAAAADAQRALELPCRMAVHAGHAEARDGDYFGPTLNRTARLRAIAHGGQVVCSEAAAALARESLRDSLDLVDLGVHRLRDLARAERVFQLVGPDLATEFPPLASLSTRNTNLPAQPSSFIGREPELERVAELLGASRLVTLTGAGGSGKTRLSQQAAADRFDDFPDGVWLAELAGVTDPELVPNALAGALSLSILPGSNASDVIVDALGDKRALVLLDNCEHVVAAAAALASSLLAGCPNVTVLATSRERLRVNGETSWPVPVLTLPGGATSDDAAASESVRLFVDRATEADPSFTLTPANVADVVDVCRRVDGIPLAIELAAARVRTLAPDELARRLAVHRGVVSGGDRTALPRHRSLSATIDWSYSLLNAVEQVTLRRLAVFRGGFTLAAAERVATGDGVAEFDVMDALEGLVDKSLLVVDVDTRRYHMLETVREFALDQLTEAGETDVWQRRHAEDVVGVAAGMRRRLFGAQQPEAALDLRFERANIAGAVAWALEHDVEIAARIIGDTWLLAFATDQTHDTVEWCRRLALVADAWEGASTARALVGVGILLGYSGDLVLGLDFTLRGITAAREGGDIAGEAEALVWRSSLFRLYDRLDESRVCADEALQLLDTHDDPFTRAFLGTWGVWIFGETGDPDLGDRLVNDAYRICVEAGDVYLRRMALDSLPETPERQAEIAELDQVLAGLVPGADEHVDTTALITDRDFEAAIPQLEALVARNHDHFRWAFMYSVELACAYHYVGRPDDAWRVLRPYVEGDVDATDIDRHSAYTSAIALLRDLGDVEQALVHTRSVLGWLRAGGGPSGWWYGFTPHIWTGVVLLLAATVTQDHAAAARLFAIGDRLVGEGELYLFAIEVTRIRSEVAPTLLPAPPDAHDVADTHSLVEIIDDALGALCS